MEDNKSEESESVVMSRIEQIIRQKLGTNFEDEFDPSKFDSILLRGVNLIELTPEDKAFLEKFDQAKVLNLSFTGLRSLKNLPVIETLERLDLSDNNLNGEDLN